MLFQKRNAGKKDNPLCSRLFYCCRSSRTPFSIFRILNAMLLIRQSHFHIVLNNLVARIAALLQVAVGHRTICVQN